MSTSLDPVRWGVLGTANIAVTKVIPAMLHSKLSRVAAIASRSAEKAAEAGAHLEIDSAYGSYEELLADPAIEAVYIPLPNNLHKDWTIAAADAGKHVLCEKPLALTSEDAREMIEVCQREGVLLMEAFMYRLHPMWRKVMSLIDEGAVGEVRSVQSVFSYHNDDPTNIRNVRALGGGAMYDIGCYCVNTARMIFSGEPMDVKAVLRKDPELGIDVLTSAVLEFEGGHTGFVCSTQMERDQRVVVHGTNGRIVVESPYNIPSDRRTTIHLLSGGSSSAAPLVDHVRVETANAYTVQADSFSRAIRRNDPPPLPPTDAVANMKVIERIFASAH